MNDQTASLIRTVCKMAGTYFAAKGIGDSTAYEAIAGGIIALVGIALSYIHHANNPTLPKT